MREHNGKQYAQVKRWDLSPRSEQAKNKDEVQF
jgi:hypothetical protein